jgi:hypothetical protein
MFEFIDVMEFFVDLVNHLKARRINPKSALEEIVIKLRGTDLAYVNNRTDALGKYRYDFWKELKKRFDGGTEFIEWIKGQAITEVFLYSHSKHFPDFLFKVRKRDGELYCGSLLELKDSKGGSIASFNSTLPTKYKSLDEVDIINGNNLVSRITSIMDGQLASDKNYHTFQRRNFYLIRTHKDNDDKVKISVVDGSFFETVPKEHLLYQIFLNILRKHLEKEKVEISAETFRGIEHVFSYITDQSIIENTQDIEQASIRPRFRIMAEVHTEGNPHSHFYPEILERSLNFIIEASICENEIVEKISKNVPDIHIFTIRHKRNADHVVFQFNF